MTARIVFDLDGTLIDSAPDICGIANAALEGLGAGPISLDQTRSFVGEGIDVFVTRMREARGLPQSTHETLLQDVISRYDDAVTLTVPYPGVEDALSALAETYRLGICTNKLHRPCISVLKHLRIERFFSTIWGGDNPLGRKPEPMGLLAAFEDLGEGPRVYVGDSETDAETARRAEVPFFLFTEGYRKQPVDSIHHEVAFSAFHELPERIAAFLSR